MTTIHRLLLHKIWIELKQDTKLTIFMTKVDEDEEILLRKYNLLHSTLIICGSSKKEKNDQSPWVNQSNILVNTIINYRKRKTILTNHLCTTVLCVCTFMYIDKPCMSSVSLIFSENNWRFEDSQSPNDSVLIIFYGYKPKSAFAQI